MFEAIMQSILVIWIIKDSKKNPIYLRKNEITQNRTDCLELQKKEKVFHLNKFDGKSEHAVAFNPNFRHCKFHMTSSVHFLSQYMYVKDD